MEVCVRKLAYVFSTPVQLEIYLVDQQLLGLLQQDIRCHICHSVPLELQRVGKYATLPY